MFDIQLASLTYETTQTTQHEYQTPL